MVKLNGFLLRAGSSKRINDKDIAFSLPGVVLIFAFVAANSIHRRTLAWQLNNG